VVSCNTPDSLRDVLKRGGFPVIVNKPLYESKLQRLLRTLAHPPHGEPSTSRSYLPPQSTSGPSSSRLWRCSSSEWEEEDFVPARSPPRTTARNSLEESGEDVFVAADNLIPLYGAHGPHESDQILKGMQVRPRGTGPRLKAQSRVETNAPPCPVLHSVVQLPCANTLLIGRPGIPLSSSCDRWQPGLLVGRSPLFLWPVGCLPSVMLALSAPLAVVATLSFLPPGARGGGQPRPPDAVCQDRGQAGGTGGDGQ
jgi:hypothetical protein